ncbi:MAG: hypothetical protein DME21_05130 [Verrucomicrobia bacterium]|nr:MAG: hypothetical protein DME21_05130 [Verrucomicrobiota bacterium]
MTELRGIEVSSAWSWLLLVLRCQVRGPKERCQYDTSNGYQTIQCLHSSYCFRVLWLNYQIQRRAVARSACCTAKLTQATCQPTQDAISQ